MTHEDMPYEEPEWLRFVRDEINAIPGTEVDAVEGGGETMARHTAEIGSEYFSVYLEHGLASALDIFQAYLGRFADGNREAGFVNPVLAEQFGLIANVASLSYADASIDERKAVMAKVTEYLSGRQDTHISTANLTAQLRDPLLLRDLVLHHSAVTWPSQNYHSRLMENATWPEVVGAIEHPASNPIMFGLAGLLNSTDPETRLDMGYVYPHLIGQSLDIVVARLFCDGAHEEILTGETHGVWEENIYNALLDYAEEFRPLILQRIVQTDWPSLLLDPKFSFEELYAKMSATRFLLSEDGRLERSSASAAPLEDDADGLGEDR